MHGPYIVMKGLLPPCVSAPQTESKDKKKREEKTTTTERVMVGNVVLLLFISFRLNVFLFLVPLVSTVNARCRLKISRIRYQME